MRPLHDVGPLRAEATSPPSELPSARQRTAVAALATTAFALNLNTNVLGALLPFVRGELHLQPGREAWLIAAGALGSAFGSLLAGPYAARRGRRSALVSGLLVFVGASIAHLLTTSFWPFFVLRLAAGVAVGVAYAAASALVAEVAPYGRRGGAMGMFSAGMFLAVALGLPASVALANAGAWTAIFAIQAGVGALGLWWTLRAVPDGRAAEAAAAPWRLLANGPVLAVLVATMLHVGSFFTTVQLATTWLDRTGRVAKEDQVWLWLGLGLASVVGSAWLARASDAFGKRNFVLAASVLLVGCFGLLAREPGPWPMLAIGTALAVVAAARTGPLQALLSGLAPADRLAGLMGLRGCVMQLGVVSFALAAAPVVSEYGFEGVLWFAALCQLASYAAIRLGVPRGR